MHIVMQSRLFTVSAFHIVSGSIGQWMRQLCSVKCNCTAKRSASTAANITVVFKNLVALRKVLSYIKNLSN